MAVPRDVILMTSLGLECSTNSASSDGLFYYHRGISNKSRSAAPILVLIHGYPQTNFMWRHLIPLLPPEIPLFIPDIPGYGRSAPLSIPHNKTNQAAAILSALDLILPRSESHPWPIFLIGHDRGARMCHRLAVSNPSSTLKIIGSVFLDIDPTLIQWQTFSIPAASVGSFHWPFLANVEFAVPIIMAQGGDVFMHTCMQRWMGTDAKARSKFEENDAISVYAEFFKLESVVRATCDDYRGGAEEDIEEQLSDQKEGRKIDAPILCVYSADYLGKRYDLMKVWQEWISDKGSLEVHGITGGVGHFIAEEAPEETASAIISFLNRNQ